MTGGQKPSQTYAEKRRTVEKPTLSYRSTAPVLAAVTVRLPERQPWSRNVISDWRNNAWPTPLPFTEGDTQICVIWPHSGATMLASETPHKWPVDASKAAYEASR